MAGIEARQGADQDGQRVAALAFPTGLDVVEGQRVAGVEIEKRHEYQQAERCDRGWQQPDQRVPWCVGGSYVAELAQADPGGEQYSRWPGCGQRRAGDAGAERAVFGQCQQHEGGQRGVERLGVLGVEVEAERPGGDQQQPVPGRGFSAGDATVEGAECREGDEGGGGDEDSGDLGIGSGQRGHGADEQGEEREEGPVGAGKTPDIVPRHVVAVLGDGQIPVAIPLAQCLGQVGLGQVEMRKHGVGCQPDGGQGGGDCRYFPQAGPPHARGAAPAGFRHGRPGRPRKSATRLAGRCGDLTALAVSGRAR